MTDTLSYNIPSAEELAWDVGVPPMAVLPQRVGPCPADHPDVVKKPLMACVLSPDPKVRAVFLPVHGPAQEALVRVDSDLVFPRYLDEEDQVVKYDFAKTRLANPTDVCHYLDGAGEVVFVGRSGLVVLANAWGCALRQHDNAHIPSWVGGLLLLYVDPTRLPWLDVMDIPEEVETEEWVDLMW